MQGYLQPDRKLSEQWQPILELASEGQLESLLQAKHAVNSSSSNLSGLHTQCTSTDCRLSISVHFPLVHNTTAALLEGSGAIEGHHPAQAAMADWEERLEELFGRDISLHENGSDALAVSVTPGILQVCNFPHHSHSVIISMSYFITDLASVHAGAKGSLKTFTAYRKAVVLH